MNGKLSLFYLFLVIAPLHFGCSKSVKEENKNTISAIPVSYGEKYKVDTSQSVVTWIGTMVLSPEDHIGYVYLSKGELLIEKGQLVGGTAEIDMNSIEYGDKKSKNTPVRHLKSPDYFDVEKFPISTIAITKVDSVNGKKIQITGNLTIKGITRSVTFPAVIEVKDGIVKARGKIIIDRTQWGIRYKSGKFYDNLADNAVSDDVEFNMEIVAKK